MSKLAGSAGNAGKQSSQGYSSSIAGESNDQGYEAPISNMRNGGVSAWALINRKIVQITQRLIAN